MVTADVIAWAAQLAPHARVSVGLEGSACAPPGSGWSASRPPSSSPSVRRCNPNSTRRRRAETSQIGSTLKRSRWESMNALTWAVCVELGRETPKRPQDRVRTPQLDKLPCAAGGSARAPRCSEDPAATRHVPPPAHTLTQPLRPDPRLRGDLRARTPNSIASRSPRSIDSWGCFDRLAARLACEMPGVETAAASKQTGRPPRRPVQPGSVVCLLGRRDRSPWVGAFPGMSLAFVVMAAINGSTGARLSVGLSGTLNGVSPTASGFSPIRGDGASRRETLRRSLAAVRRGPFSRSTWRVLRWPAGRRRDPATRARR